MNVEEFQNLLSKYPIKRKKTHCRISWNQQSHGELSESEVQSSESKTDTQSTVQYSNMSLFQALQHYLLRFYAPNDVAEIINIFKKDLVQYVHNLNLDDIEDLCCQINNFEK